MDTPRLPCMSSSMTFLSGVQRMSFGSSPANGTVRLVDAAAEVGLAVILGATGMLLPLPPYNTGEQGAIAATKSAMRVMENLLTMLIFEE